MNAREITVTLTEKQAKLICEHVSPISLAAIDPIRYALADLPSEMEEPQHLGAVVMADLGGIIAPVVRSACALPWVDDRGNCYEWDDLANPRSLTLTERRQYGVLDTLPEGHVAMERVERYKPSTIRGLASELHERIGDQHYKSVQGLILEAYADALEAAEAGR